jgi:hypothetical protein
VPSVAFQTQQAAGLGACQLGQPPQSGLPLRPVQMRGEDLPIPRPVPEPRRLASGRRVAEFAQMGVADAIGPDRRLQRLAGEVLALRIGDARMSISRATPASRSAATSASTEAPS